MTVVSVAEAQAKLPELIDKVAAGEGVVITRDDKPVAQMLPIQQTKPQPRFGSCKGMLTILQDDEDHLEQFKEYMP
jgi:prevent-host-death family protein